MNNINEVRERLGCLAVIAGAQHAADLRALLAGHARLQAQVSLAAELLERLDGYTRGAPEKECRCHISPPCSDCVDWGGRRELDGHVIDFIAEHGEAVQS